MDAVDTKLAAHGTVFVPKIILDYFARSISRAHLRASVKCSAKNHRFFKKAMFSRGKPRVFAINVALNPTFFMRTRGFFLAGEPLLQFVFRGNSGVWK